MITRGREGLKNGYQWMDLVIKESAHNDGSVLVGPKPLISFGESGLTCVLATVRTTRSTTVDIQRSSIVRFPAVSKQIDDFAILSF